MGVLFQDVRYGLRMLAKNPGFTAVAVLTLALGIGVTTTIFTAANDFLLRPLPFGNSDRLVIVKRYFREFPQSGTNDPAHASSSGGSTTMSSKTWPPGV